MTSRLALRPASQIQRICQAIRLNPRVARVAGPLLLAITTLSYFAIAQFIILLGEPVLQGAGFWPAAGVTVSILLLTPTRRWLWVLAGIVLAELISNLIHGYPLGAVPWWAAGNAIEPLLGAWLVRRFASPRGELVPLRNLLAFLALAVVVASLVGASVGSVGTVNYIGREWGEVWPRYVVGDALGILVVAPVFLTTREALFRRPLAETAAVVVGLVVTSLATLQPWPGSLELVSPYFVVPFLTWAALRFGIRGSAWFVFLFAQMTNLTTAFDRGPFAELASSPAEAITMLQVFLLIAASSTLVLAALVSELSDREQVQRVLRDLADTMPQLVWVANDDAVVEFYNRRGEAYFGPDDSLAGARDWRNIVHPDDLDRTLAEWQAAASSGEAFECEHRISLVDGTFRWHLSRAERLAAIDQVQWYGTSTDIHDLKMADELKDQFIAIASHELRNPAGAIHGMTQQLRRALVRGALTPERLEAYSTSLVDRSAYLARLTQDLMDVSRLQRGALPLHLELTALTPLIESVVTSDEWPSERFRWAAPRDLGVLDVDPARVRQVLVNLLDNALKYSPSHEEIHVRAHADGEGILIEVVDRGIGLPAEALDLVFTPFGRAVNTGTVPGLGMGLYVAREIAERHGGRLWAESAGEGYGTTMYFWLPNTNGTGAEAVTVAGPSERSGLGRSRATPPAP